jgi:hypothetical protein
MASNMTPLVPFSILVIVVLLGFLFSTSNNRAQLATNVKGYNLEKFATNSPIAPLSQPADTSIAALADSKTNLSTVQSGYPSTAGNAVVNASDAGVGDEQYNPVVSPPMAPVSSCYPRDRLTSSDLLPNDAADSRWAQMNPGGQGDISDQNFLTAGYHIGINTVGSSMKNANLQLRSEPPNPRLAMSPLNISTIEFSDINRRPLEIGGDY